MKKGKVASWLFKKFHEYQLSQGQTITQEEFANYFGS
jgi:hypothetical protein